MFKVWGAFLVLASFCDHGTSAYGVASAMLIGALIGGIIEWILED